MSLPLVQCQLCHVTFSDESVIGAHYDTAHSDVTHYAKRSDRTHECDVCGKTFTRSSSMKQHQASVHGVGDVKTFQCQLCARVFNRKFSLHSHMKYKHKATADV